MELSELKHKLFRAQLALDTVHPAVTRLTLLSRLGVFNVREKEKWEMVNRSYGPWFPRSAWRQRARV